MGDLNLSGDELNVSDRIPLSCHVIYLSKRETARNNSITFPQIAIVIHNGFFNFDHKLILYFLGKFISGCFVNFKTGNFYKN